jgi:hypothetical protein
MKFVSGFFRHRLDERERRVRKLLPDGEIFRCYREPAKRKHVSAGFSHFPNLLPCYFIDAQSFPLRL